MHIILKLTVINFTVLLETLFSIFKNKHFSNFALTIEKNVNYNNIFKLEFTKIFTNFSLEIYEEMNL